MERPEDVIVCTLIAAVIYGAAHAGIQIVSQAHGRGPDAAAERGAIDSDGTAPQYVLLQRP